MDSDLSQFIGDIRQYNPLVIVVLVGGLIIFVFCVIDTHRHRKKIKRSGISPKNIDRRGGGRRANRQA